MAELAAYLQDLDHSGRLLIGVDGFGGSGKSTFANKLSRYLPEAKIVHIDSFYEPIDSADEPKLDFNWDRFERDILTPAQEHEPIEYRRFDWKSGKYLADEKIPEGAPIIAEGVYCTQKRFLKYYSYKIWIDVSESERLNRGMLRDGEGRRYEWENIWLPYTREYLKNNEPHVSADLVIDGVRSTLESEDLVIIEKNKG